MAKGVVGEFWLGVFPIIPPCQRPLVGEEKGAEEGEDEGGGPILVFLLSIKACIIA
jgi:hypothetical protein